MKILLSALDEMDLAVFLKIGFTLVLRGRKEMFYLMIHSIPFIYCYMVSDIW